MHKFYFLLFLAFFYCGLGWGQAVSRPAAKTPAKRESPNPPGSSKKKNSSFRINRPGEIVFEEGFTVEGRIEKPQLVYILSKEKVKLAPVDFSRSLLGYVTRSTRYNTFELYQEEDLKAGKKGLKKK